MSESNFIEYRSIEGFPGYRVGNDGSVWSCWRRGPSSAMSSIWTQRKLKKQKEGYLSVGLIRNRNYSWILVHRLVLEAFVGPCPDGMECRHLNGIRVDCRLENLAWGTRKENTDDKKTHGTTAMGEKISAAKLNASKIQKIRLMYAAGETQTSLAKTFGVSQAAIWCILNKKTWVHVA